MQEQAIINDDFIVFSEEMIALVEENFLLPCVPVAFLTSPDVESGSGDDVLGACLQDNLFAGREHWDALYQYARTNWKFASTGRAVFIRKNR
jgi:hypothetical protein